MEVLLLGAVQLAIGWLVVWYCIDRSKPSKTWWPFDYVINPAAPTTEEESKPTDTLRIGRRQTARPWRRSGF
jgi:hypothetical protein